MAQILKKTKAWQLSGPNLKVHYSRGLFTVSQPLGDTEWFAVYAYTVKTMVQALKGPLSLYGAIALGMLLVLWVAVLSFITVSFCLHIKILKEYMKVKNLVAVF